MELQEFTPLDQILRFQEEALKRENGANPEDVCPVTHHFAPGLYAREMFIPAGAYVVGKMHRFAHLNTVSKGRIRVASAHGNREICAPATFLSQPGIKRVGVALEDTIWTTYHPTNETDLAAIEAEVIVPEDLSLPETKQESIKWHGEQ